jgi:hypothetical protein
MDTSRTRPCWYVPLTSSGPRYFPFGFVNFKPVSNSEVRKQASRPFVSSDSCITVKSITVGLWLCFKCYVKFGSPLLFAVCSELSSDVERRCKEINFLSWHSGRFGTPSLPPSLVSKAFIYLRVAVWTCDLKKHGTLSTASFLQRRLSNIWEFLCWCLHFLHILNSY